MATNQMKFWYSKTQRQHGDYVDQNPAFGAPRPIKHNYALIDGQLREYTECYGGGDESYEPNFDDAIFLGVGQYACSDWNIRKYLKQHPEVRVGQDEEWPDVVG